MAVQGDLETMPLAELFQWAGGHRKSGVLEISQGRGRIQFLFKQGRIVGCASNDPPSLLGQFLLSRGKIDEQTLQDALAEQDRSGRNLGLILLCRGVLNKAELDRYVVAKAEETIFKLFEWPSARFEFDSARRPLPSLVEVEIQVDDVLLRGAQRQDELARMRAVFHDPGMVLCRTDHRLHPETARSPMATRLYGLIDGRRTYAEILVLSRASEFLATKFLFELYRRGVITIRDVHRVAPTPGTPEAACELARRLMAREEHDAALDVLHASHATHPAHQVLRQTIARAEAAYLDHAYAAHLSSSQVPVPTGEREAAGSLAANELCVLDLVADGRWSVKALTRIAPLYEIDVVRALVGLQTKGLIRLEGRDVRPGVELPEVHAVEAHDALADLNAALERALADEPDPSAADARERR